LVDLFEYMMMHGLTNPKVSTFLSQHQAFWRKDPMYQHL